MNRDKRSVILTVEAGGQSAPQVFTAPKLKMEPNLETFVLQGVSAETSEVMITLEAPAVGRRFPRAGDSAAMIAAKAH